MSAPSPVASTSSRLASALPLAARRVAATGVAGVAARRSGRSPLGRPDVLALVVLAMLAAACVGPAGAAEVAPVEATSAVILPSFSPDRLGAKAAFTFAVHFTGGELGVPSPVRRAVVQLPPGLTMDIPRLRICTGAQLRARGARGCPARSEIGRGRALGDVHAGAGVESEEVEVSAYVGPPQGTHPTIEILGQGYTPLEKRVVITGTALPDSPPYGEKLVLSIPPISTIPLEPNASTVSFSLTIGGAAFRRHDPNTVLLPTSCPAGGFPFAAEFAYEDGSTSTTTATVPCPHRVPPPGGGLPRPLRRGHVR
jgi:hypothetical protein